MHDYYRSQLHPILRILLRSDRSRVLHYFAAGAKAGLNPHHLFESDWYLRKNRDVRERGANPLEHYLRHGVKENRCPSPFVETAWYFDQLGISNTKMNPLMVYRLARAAGSRQSPTPFFDPAWYQANSPDLTPASDLFEHFMCFGRKEKRAPNRFFNSSWYLREYPDVDRPGQGAPNHFMLYGSDENRDPSVLFSTSYYRSAYPDLRESQTNPLVHYISSGRSEGRIPFDADVLPAETRIAVIVHLFHKEIRQEITRYLGSIPKPFDLYISVPKADPDLVDFVRRRYPKATVLEVNNIGHDVAPFFQFLAKIFASGISYTAICKIHTKKGVTHPSLWRRLLLQSTLKNKYLVSEIVRSFIADENLYLAGAADLYVSGWEFIGPNGRQLAELCVDLYPGRPFPPSWGFIAGTMFWVRPDMLRGLTNLVSKKRDYFVDNASATDGQFSHALERMIGCIGTFDNRTVALVRSSGDGPRDFTVDYARAASSATTEQTHILLNRLAKQYPSWSKADGGPNARRVWQPGRDAEFGVHFVAPVTYLNGLGASARNYLSAIVDDPFNASVEAWSWGFDRLETFPFDVPPRSDQPIHIIHLNLDLLHSLSVNDPPRFAALFPPDKYYVLICYFELISLFPEWSSVLDKFDEVWCASNFMLKAISAASTIKVRLVRPPLTLTSDQAPRASRRQFGLDEDRFVFAYFLDAGSVMGRKNPEALLNAYCNAFEFADGACCYLKIHYGEPEALLSKEIQERIAGRSDIVVSNKIFSSLEMRSLFDTIDCYVSPHRSEGLGLTIIEAMNAGKPVIATPYGGAADFVTESTAFALPYRWTEVGEGNLPYPATYVWADPDVGSLSSIMREVFQDRDSARARGRAGQKFIRACFGKDSTAQAVRGALDAIWQSAGRPPLLPDVDVQRKAS